MSEKLREEFSAVDSNNKDANELDFTANEVGARRTASVRGIISKYQLWTLYLGIFLITFAIGIEQNLDTGLLNIALEEFKANALTSVVSVLTELIGIIFIPLFSLLSDYFGRTELFFISLMFYFIGLIISFCSNNFATFVFASTIKSIGSTGYSIIKLVLMADLTSLANRVNFNSVDMVPFVLCNWIGSYAITPISENLDWRWSYKIPAIAFGPFVALFFGMMFYLQHKAKKQTITFVSVRHFGLKSGLKKIVNEFDLVGFILLVVSLSCIMLPLIMAGDQEDGWNTPSMIALMVIGGLLLVGLIVWLYKYSKYPLIPMRFLRNSTTLGAMLIIFFVRMDSGLNWQYFTQYFMISRKLDPTSASLLFKGYQMGYLVACLVTGILIKKMPNFKHLLIVGAIINCIGLGTMIPARFPHSSDVLIHVTQTLSGIGQGIVDMCVIVAYQGSVSRKDVAIVTSTSQLVLSIGSSVGGTIGGAIWTQVVPQLINKYTKGNDIDYSRVLNEMNYVWDLPEQQFEQVIAGYGDGQMIISGISCALAGLSLLVAIFMIKPIDVHNTQKFDDKIDDKEEE
ncbi:MFS general substrate transporter [Neoconidiobolus thromboides FSU 785]|nr:MFS general substrate transporter [Neoconidiobolus thromboides FSU 785]